MAWLIGLGLLGMIVGIVGFSAWMARRQAMTWVHPARIIPDETPSDRGLTDWEAVQFSSADGTSLVGWFVRPTVEANGATVILLHGLGGHRGSMLDQAAILGNAGYQTLLFDLRAHGESGGSVSTLGYRETEDVGAALEYLRSRADLNIENLGILGFSLGGVTAIRAAAQFPELRAIVAESAFRSPADTITPILQALTGRPPFPFAGAVMAWVNQETGVDVYAVRPIEDISTLAPRPLLLIHGQQDTVVPVSDAQALYAAAAEPKRITVIPNAAHGGFQAVDATGYTALLRDFFDEFLSQ
jgi:fermentation-respiration switch protein FrsA (DUF1100 family)